MLPDTPHQQFILPRIVKAKERLAAEIWTTSPRPLDVWQTPPTRDHRTLADVKPREFRRIEPTGEHHWGKLFDQCWWRVKLPKDITNAYLLWRDEAEATVYIDGIPHYGIDPGHHHAPLPDGTRELVIESLCARTGIWVEGATQGLDTSKGSRFLGAHLATRNEDAWHAWHDLDVLIGVMSLLDKPEYQSQRGMWARGGHRPELAVVEPLLRRLIHRTNQAIDELDRRGIAACRKSLAKLYRDFPAAPDAMTALLTGHAHIDLVWLWPERAGDFKAVHSFANALSIMQRYPEATFGYSQPASYQAVERRSPELMARVRKQVKRGRWEPTGAMYVESDVQLPCGEGLVRAFALGQKGFKQLRGSESRCVWLPDVFGYSACLPTIMAGFGVPYFYTTKLHWSGATRFPHSSFRWVGMDGSEVVSHISWDHYNQRVTPSELKHADYQHRQSHLHDESLFPCGYGDGGGGLNESMCERARRLANLASMPRAKWGTIEGFFDRLADLGDALPRWRGEMYLEYHRGVQTTHSDLKAAFRAAERSLQILEAVRCATAGGPIDEQPWKRVCFAQFHDYIPGSSIPEVYQEQVPELQAIAADTLAQAERELNDTAAGSKKPSVPCVFNPLAMPRRELIDGKLVELPPLAGVPIDALEPLDAEPATATTTRLTNGRVDARFNAAGEIKSLTVEGHRVAIAGSAAQLWTFADIPATYDAWDIDRYTLSEGTHHRTKVAAAASHDATGARFRFERDLPGIGTAATTYLLEPGAAVLRIEIDLELTTPQALVKLAFPTDYRGREARYGAPFGSVRRPQWPGPLANDAMFENPASRWAAIADDTEADGLMLVTESKYGVGASEGLLHLSLARSAQATPTNRNATTTELDTSGDDHTYADLGTQRIRLAVGRFSAQAPRDQQPAALADLLFTPTLRYQGQPIDAGLRQIDAPESMVPAWAVPNAKRRDWTLRLHETLGGRGSVKLHLTTGLASENVDLRNTPDSANANDVTPYQLRSLRIRKS
ncbi:MAG: glycoside hydrolase family 38 C-terminal domain-containing protein [Planctomycetota bacterium]